MGSKKKKKNASDRAAELREQAREVAGQSGEAFKDFAESTGSAAKEFASQTREAAKLLLESIERAAQRVEPKQSRRGRKLVVAGVALGVGASLLARDKIRAALFGKSRRTDPWEQRYTGGNGVAREPAIDTPEQTV